jgi:hypothetical protein
MLNGYDIHLAADQIRLASRLRDALTSIAPTLERAVADRLHQAGVRDLLVSTWRSRRCTLRAGADRAGGQVMSSTVHGRLESGLTASADSLAARLSLSSWSDPADSMPLRRSEYGQQDSFVRVSAEALVAMRQHTV